MHRASMNPARLVTLLVSSLLLAIGLGSPAWADGPPGTWTIVQMEPGAPLPAGSALPIAVGQVATVRFPGKVREIRSRSKTAVHAAAGVDTVAIEPLPEAAPGDGELLEVIGQGFPPYTLPVTIVEAASDTPTQWSAIPTTQVEARRSEIKRLEGIVSAKDAELKKKDRERARAVQGAKDTTLLVETHSSKFRVVRLDAQGCEGKEIAICPDTFVEADEHGVIKLWLHNRSPHDLEAKDTQAQVIDQDTGSDHAALLLLTDDKDRPVSLIPSGARVKASVLLRDPAQVGNAIKVVLSGKASVLPAVRYMEIPDTWEWAENERRKERREREAKRVSLHLTGSYGALFLASGVAGLEGTEATSLKSLGLRFTKGFIPALAFEAEIGGATSGVATFDDVTIDGMTGDLTRSARLGRVTVGGVLRFGDTVVPNVRLGVGLQVVDQDATLMTASGPVDGPGAGLEVGGSVYGGAGVDVKLGSNLLLGAGLLFTQSDQRILDFGLNLAYRWDASE